MEKRKKILALQEKMLTMEQTLDQFPLTHHFAPGVYAREMFLPSGHTVIGKIHKHAHLNFLMKGVVRVSTEDGSKELTAPCVFTSYAGTKRAVYIKEDAIWVTVHVTEETDLDEIENEIIAKTFEEFDADTNKRKTKNIKEEPQ